MLNASGQCECGCGRATRIAPRTIGRLGWVKGEPIRFIRGHCGHKFTSPDGTRAPLGSKRQRVSWRAAVARVNRRRREEQLRELAQLHKLTADP
jgi:hypothetical protein